MSASPKLPHSVNEWKAGFRGIVKPSLYEVMITGNGWNTVLGNAGLDQATTRELIVHCESAKFPGSAIGTQPNRIYGPVREFAYERIYSGDISLTFRMDESMNLRRIFDRWHSLIYDSQSGDFSYYDDYKADILIFQYPTKQAESTAGGATSLPDARKPIYGVRVNEAFPKSIGEIELGYDQTNTYMKQDIDFAFRSWEEIPLSEL
tara:strand:+ start:11 stop:628 length:618 start_codon:yes stop_codon:yes gene_type:complete